MLDQPRSYAIDLTLPQIPLWVPEAARRELADLILASMRLALQQAAGFLSDEAPRDTGGLAQSFGADPATETGGLELTGTTGATDEFTGRVFSSLPYAVVMDEGRRRGAPINRAGIDAIGLWAQRKLGLSSAEAQRAKWGIATSIIARGLPGTQYFQKGVRQAEPQIERMFSILAGQIEQALTRTGGAA